MPERRVAFLSEHATPIADLGSVDAGGQNVYVDEVSRGLGALGWHVDIFTRREAPNAPEVIDWAPNVRVIHLTAGPPDWIPKDDIWQHMPAFRDALFAHAAREGTQYDLIHGNFWMSGWAAVELSRLWRVPAVQIFHATGKTKRRHQGEADTSPLERIAVELGVVRAVHRLIAQCPEEERELIDDYGADPGKVAVIPSAVNIERFRPVDRSEARAALGLDPEARMAGYIGRMLPRKDVRTIVRALPFLRDLDPPVMLLAVGGETASPDPAATPEIGVLHDLAAELGVADRVIFTGKRCPDALHLYYGACDVMVTTPWYEPFGLTPLEAMACGRPVIGSSVGGITFTIEHGVTGYHVPPRDPRALAARLRELLTDPELRERIGRAGRRRAAARFTWPVVAARTAALYADLLSVGTVAPSGYPPGPSQQGVPPPPHTHPSLAPIGRNHPHDHHR